MLLKQSKDFTKEEMHEFLEIGRKYNFIAESFLDWIESKTTSDNLTWNFTLSVMSILLTSGSLDKKAVTPIRKFYEKLAGIEGSKNGRTKARDNYRKKAIVKMPSNKERDKSKALLSKIPYWEDMEPKDRYEKVSKIRASGAGPYPTEFIVDGGIDWEAEEIYGLGPFNYERILLKMCIEGNPTYAALVAVCLETPLTQKRVNRWIEAALLPDPMAFPPGLGPLIKNRGRYSFEFDAKAVEKALKALNKRISKHMS